MRVIGEIQHFRQPFEKHARLAAALKDKSPYGDIGERHTDFMRRPNGLGDVSLLTPLILALARMLKHLGVYGLIERFALQLIEGVATIGLNEL